MSSSPGSFDVMQEQLARHERDIADVRHGLNGAKQVFDIRFNQVIASIGELKSILKWAGGLIITLMISFMSWSALQQFNANETQKRDLQNQITLMESQDKGAKDRDLILRELRKDLDTSGGTVTPITTNRSR